MGNYGIQKVLSIVVPSYNMEKYLRNTLDSCVTSEDEMDLYEVIIVNDGSEDSTQEIANEYVKKYGNTFRLVNKENGGWGSAVNEGMRAAVGKYVRILDGDDWYDPNALKKFVGKLLKTDADIVITNMKKLHEKTGKTEFVPINLNEDIVFDSEQLEKQGLSIWESCYKTAIFKDHDICLTSHCSYADTQMVVFPLRYVSTAVYYSVALYYYRYGRPGQSVSKKSLAKSALDFEKVIKDINCFLDNAEGGDKNGKRIECGVANAYYAFVCAMLLRPCNGENKKKIKEYLDELQYKYPYGFSNVSCVKAKLLLKSNYKLYGFCHLVAKFM